MTTIYLDVTTAARETTAKILARRHAANGKPLTVTVSATGGATASVDYHVATNRVYLGLPSMPAHAPLARHEADRVVGFIAHECCHVLHTDWDAWRRAVAAGPRVRLWTNALEDVRIEAKEIRNGTFPALRGMLAGLMDHMHYKAVTQAHQINRTVGARVDDAPYVSAVLGRIRNKYPVPSAARLERDLSPDVRRLVTHALARLPGCRSTSDVLTLALELVGMEATMAPPLPEPPAPLTPPTGEAQEGQGEDGAPGEAQEGQGEDGAPGEAQEGQGEDGASGEAQEGEGEDSAPGEAQEGQGEDSASGAPGGAAAGDPTANHGPPLDPTANLDELVERVMERMGPNARDLTARGGLHGWSAERIQARGIGVPGMPDVSDTFNAALPGRAVLAGQISRLLVSPERTWVTHRETSGRIDRRALARLDTGAPDVFSQRHYREGTDTALAVLIDLSGSMRGTRLAVARVAAWHIALAAEQAGARVGVFGFLEPTDGVQASVTLVTAIPFGVSVRANSHALNRLHHGLGTRLAPGILATAELLREQPAHRHIMIVLTDGMCDYGSACVTEACHVADTWNVETVGVGISAPRVVDAFPDDRSINVDSLEDLGRTGLGVLADMLEAHGMD